jgi:hypothetical protein
MRPSKHGKTNDQIEKSWNVYTFNIEIYTCKNIKVKDYFKHKIYYIYMTLRQSDDLKVNEQ